MLNPENKLEALLSMNDHFSSELFSVIDTLEIQKILQHSTEFQRFQLMYKFKDYAVLRLMRFFSLNEISQSFTVMSLPKLHRILISVDHDQRLDLISKMSIKDQLRAFSCQSKEELNQFVQKLTPFQKRRIVSIFTNIRASPIYKAHLDQTYLDSIKGLQDFLDNICELVSQSDLTLILKSQDPIFVFSRFTPKERRFLRYLMTRSQIILLLLLHGNSLQKFPSDFFPRGSNYDCLSDEYTWNTFWDDLKFEESRRLIASSALMRKTLLETIDEDG